MKVRYLVAMTAVLSVSAAAFAADKAETLFKDGNCNNCHTVGNKTVGTVGPTLVEVAAKYKDDKEARKSWRRRFVTAARVRGG